MMVFSLSGQSGTGKSTSAIEFAHKHSIDAIIDDGILIIRGEKVAGTSAKFEKNTITAVRRAIFENDFHKEEVRFALDNADVESILIIGTSDNMTAKIAKRLELGPIDRFHYVTDIRTTPEIQMARFIRETQGKHLMPISYNQVEQNFFKRLVQKGKDIFSSNRVKLGETTIVRPDFHQETITIARSVYVDLVNQCAREHEAVSRVEAVHVSMTGLPKLALTLHIAAPVNYDVVQAICGLQKTLSKQYHHHFAVTPEKIDLYIKSVESRK